jgi:uncharacterized repeat protein (TIGR03803 family)
MPRSFRSTNRRDRTRPLQRVAAALLAVAVAPAFANFTNERTIMSFPDQAWPCEACQMPPTYAADGLLYGTFEIGGANGVGVLYGLDVVRRGYKVIYDFTAETGVPVGYLTAGSDGAFYGVTRGGGRFGGGIAYRLTRTGFLKVLHDFEAGTAPVSLMEASDGALYGTTDQGGDHQVGSIFRIDAHGQYTELHAFSTGFTSPQGSPAGMQLMEGWDFRLYGVTSVGGDNGTGAVYSYGLHDGTFAVTYSFGAAGSGDAASPNSRLSESLNGTFYGTSDRGGASDLGTLYHISAFGQESVIHSFAGGADGTHPFNGITQNPDSTLYGVTTDGGSDGGGTAWIVDATDKFGHLYDFGAKHTDGTVPAGFTFAVDGKLYGVTFERGKHGNGTFFGLRLTPER